MGNSSSPNAMHKLVSTLPRLSTPVQDKNPVHKRIRHQLENKEKKDMICPKKVLKRNCFFKPRDESLRARDWGRRDQPNESEPSIELVDDRFAPRRPAALHRPTRLAYG